MSPHGYAISSFLSVVPSSATLEILSPKSLIEITGSHDERSPEPRTLPLNYL
jgi:hypothetical protein